MTRHRIVAAVVLSIAAGVTALIGAAPASAAPSHVHPACGLWGGQWTTCVR